MTETSDTHACMGGCGRQGAQPWMCGGCVEGARILNRNALESARLKTEHRKSIVVDVRSKLHFNQLPFDQGAALADFMLNEHREDWQDVVLDVRDVRPETLISAFCIGFLTRVAQRASPLMLSIARQTRWEVRHDFQRSMIKTFVEDYDLKQRTCICHRIVNEDSTRHFKECPERELYPTASSEPCNSCNGSGRVLLGEQPADIRANVMAFHAEVIGGEMPGYPSVPEEGVARRRLRLIAEEFFETLRAVFSDKHQITFLSTAIKEAENLVNLIISDATLDVDLVAFADGLADLMYVAEGGFIGFGIDSRPVHAEVQRSNMAKKGGAVRADGKRLKPPGWTPPDIVSIIETQKTRGSA